VGGSGGDVEKRMVFHFKDGSVLEESVILSQQSDYTMRRYRLLQRVPDFDEDIDASLDAPPGCTA